MHALQEAGTVTHKHTHLAAAADSLVQSGSMSGSSKSMGRGVSGLNTTRVALHPQPSMEATASDWGCSAVFHLRALHPGHVSPHLARWTAAHTVLGPMWGGPMRAGTNSSMPSSNGRVAVAQVAFQRVGPLRAAASRATKSDCGTTTTMSSSCTGGPLDPTTAPTAGAAPVPAAAAAAAAGMFLGRSAHSGSALMWVFLLGEESGEEEDGEEVLAGPVPLLPTALLAVVLLLLVALAAVVVVTAQSSDRGLDTSPLRTYIGDGWGSQELRQGHNIAWRKGVALQAFRL